MQDVRLEYRVPGGRVLVLGQQAVRQMRRYEQRNFWQREAGGVLLGRHLLDDGNIVVDEVTTPQRSDRRSRTTFFRSAKHQEIAHRKWLESNQTVAYLGLWHTHPEGDPTPSHVDKDDWKQALRQDSFEGTRLFFIIVGTKRLRVWTQSQRGQLQELRSRHGE